MPRRAVGSPGRRCGERSSCVQNIPHANTTASASAALGGRAAPPTTAGAADAADGVADNADGVADGADVVADSDDWGAQPCAASCFLRSKFSCLGVGV